MILQKQSRKLSYYAIVMKLLYYTTVLFQSHENGLRINIWTAPCLLFGRTGDPRENCWKGEKKERFHATISKEGSV